MVNINPNSELYLKSWGNDSKVIKQSLEKIYGAVRKVNEAVNLKKVFYQYSVFLKEREAVNRLTDMGMKIESKEDVENLVVSLKDKYGFSISSLADIDDTMYKQIEDIVNEERGKNQKTQSKRGASMKVA